MTVQERVEQIYEAERENIYSYLLYFGLPAARAQELAQDSFLKLYLKMEKGDPIENPRAWLYRVAHNLALRSWRREPQFDEMEPDFAALDMRPDPERALLEEQQKSALYQAVRKLSPRQRNCLHLRVEGLRYREIAEITGISVSAVGEFLSRAAARLKEAMNG
ncbi:MAG TPA: sigma-70 family RNA polymerase sigma factor [Bryobacteraceae bacterium]|nr:sigma-70 family RNA polymerase sigma factor [Bryobacteraceae bacterium]